MQIPRRSVPNDYNVFAIVLRAQTGTCRRVKRPFRFSAKNFKTGDCGSELAVSGTTVAEAGDDKKAEG